MFMKQKVCLITGGAGFLGRKFCEFFSKKNFKVLCIDNNKKNIKKINELNLKNLIVYNCDITNHDKVEKLYKVISKSFFVDVLINNAAIDAIPFKKNDINQKFPTSEMWDKEFDASLKGSFFMIKFFGEAMILKKKGSIINIGSDLSIIAPNQKIYKSSYDSYIKPVTYAVIKHGMVGLTKYFSSLYGEKNVRVNMVSPGPVKNNQNTKLLSEIENMTPMERLGNPKDIFGLLFFLANDDSSYITGQNILVDGGKTII
jgi:NAD(P)-dependent dehydrogenase (short-subunit alcohol dehydrogenase family)